MKTLFTFLASLISFFSFGQSQVGTVEFQKNDQPAAVLQLPYTPDVVSAGVASYMAKKGKGKGSDIKGFTSFKNSSKDSVNSDLYFKVERKSRKEKDVTIISLLLGLPKEVLPAGVIPGYLTMDQAKSFLNYMIPTIEAENLEAQIKEQTAAVSKAENKYKNLIEDGSDLEKKKLSIEKKIQENKDDQQKQTSEVDAQKQKLAALIALRKR